jgi:hypothetical protein
MAQLQGAMLVAAWLPGAILDHAQLQGASLDMARLQGADLNWAQLQGASLSGTRLQGASFHKSDLRLALISGALLWRAGSIECPAADGPRIVEPDFQPLIELEPGPTSDQPVVTSPSDIEDFIRRVVADVPKEDKDLVADRLRAKLTPDPTRDTADKDRRVWDDCANETSTSPERYYFAKLTRFLLGMVCPSGPDQKYIAEQIYGNWIRFDSKPAVLRYNLARGMLGLDDKPCPGAAGLDAKIKGELKKLATTSPTN